ncbi:hypothetical protein ASG93_24915 [Paenibacillus sp. Soil787]|nr:hypothetical protein ASG93_24915 [Paenibacillus sp. Soil787]
MIAHHIKFNNYAKEYFFSLGKKLDFIERTRQHGLARWYLEKSISDFSSSVGELRLAGPSLKARFSRLLVQALQNKRVFRAYFELTRQDGLLRSRFSTSQALLASFSSRGSR